MKISPNTLVALTYELKVDGELVDQATTEKPLEFIYDAGMILPAFEAQIKDLEPGQNFDFELDAANGYGEKTNDNIVELPKSSFMIDGKIEEGMLEKGNAIPMMNNMGHQMVGVVNEVGESTVQMDFNHPLAGKSLHFTGTIVDVHEATEEDKAKFMGGGCGCGCDSEDCADGCSDDCNCGCQPNPLMYAKKGIHNRTPFFIATEYRICIFNDRKNAGGIHFMDTDTQFILGSMNGQFTFKNKGLNERLSRNMTAYDYFS